MTKQPPIPSISRDLMKSTAREVSRRTIRQVTGVSGSGDVHVRHLLPEDLNRDSDDWRVEFGPSTNDGEAPVGHADGEQDAVVCLLGFVPHDGVVQVSVEDATGSVIERISVLKSREYHSLNWPVVANAEQVLRVRAAREHKNVNTSRVAVVGVVGEHKGRTLAVMAQKPNPPKRERKRKGRPLVSGSPEDEDEDGDDPDGEALGLL